MEETPKTHLLEINLISAQNLKPPSANLRRTLQTYATAHVNPSFKLRTQTRPGPNPNWNEKFLFRVTPAFLSSQTSSVSVSVYSLGLGPFPDSLIGTVRFLLPLSLSSSHPSLSRNPVFSAVQIRRPSGRFQGVLNVAAAVADAENIFIGSPAVCVRDLSAESIRNRKKRSESSEWSDESSSSSSTWTVGSDGEMGSDGGGLLCCLGVQRKVHLGPSDRILRALTH